MLRMWETHMWEIEETFALLHIFPNKEGILCSKIAKYIIRYLESETEERDIAAAFDI